MRALSSARIPMRLGEGGWTLLAHWSDPPQALANFNPSGVATTLSSLLIVFCYRRNIFTGPVDLHENDDAFSRPDTNFFLAGHYKIAQCDWGGFPPDTTYPRFSLRPPTALDPQLFLNNLSTGCISRWNKQEESSTELTSDVGRTDDRN